MWVYAPALRSAVRGRPRSAPPCSATAGAPTRPSSTILAPATDFVTCPSTVTASVIVVETTGRSTARGRSPALRVCTPSPPGSAHVRRCSGVAASRSPLFRAGRGATATAVSPRATPSVDFEDPATSAVGVAPDQFSPDRAAAQTRRVWWPRTLTKARSRRARRRTTRRRARPRSAASWNWRLEAEVGPDYAGRAPGAPSSFLPCARSGPAVVAGRGWAPPAAVGDAARSKHPAEPTGGSGARCPRAVSERRTPSKASSAIGDETTSAQRYRRWRTPGSTASARALPMR